MTSTQPGSQPGTSQTTHSRDSSPIAQVKHSLDQMRAQLAATLPAHISVERFQRIVLTAINTNPDLLSADRRSLFNACMRAAQDGLLPDNREGALVIFKDKTGKKLVSWLPMVFGLIKKIRQSGEIDSIGARIVYQNEITEGRFKFVIEEGQEKLYHDPMLFGARGDKVLVYAYARFAATGHVEYAPLHRDDVMKRRAASRGGNIWQAWEEEMWLKTAIRSLSKRLPLSSEIMRTVEREPETRFDQLKASALQDSAVAMQQLGAPEPEQETSEGEVDNFAKEVLQGAMNRMADEPMDRDALVEFGDHIRQVLRGEPIDDELRERLLGEFDGAFQEKLKALERLV